MPREESRDRQPEHGLVESLRKWADTAPIGDTQIIAKVGDPWMAHLMALTESVWAEGKISYTVRQDALVWKRV